MNPGTKPKITFEQYKEIMRVKKEKQGERPKRGTMELTYVKLSKKLGLRASAVFNAARRGIKRYDYMIWKETREGTK